MFIAGALHLARETRASNGILATGHESARLDEIRRRVESGFRK